jgi:hypothetical protein
MFTVIREVQGDYHYPVIVVVVVVVVVAIFSYSCHTQGRSEDKKAGSSSKPAPDTAGKSNVHAAKVGDTTSHQRD